MKLKKIGSFENFQEEFTNKSLTLFGSGWVWLTKTFDESLKIFQSPNQNNPYSEKSGTPIFGINL